MSGFAFRAARSERGVPAEPDEACKRLEQGSSVNRKRGTLLSVRWKAGQARGTPSSTVLDPAAERKCPCRERSRSRRLCASILFYDRGLPAGNLSLRPSSARIPLLLAAVGRRGVPKEEESSAAESKTFPRNRARSRDHPRQEDASVRVPNDSSIVRNRRREISESGRAMVTRHS